MIGNILGYIGRYLPEPVFWCALYLVMIPTFVFVEMKKWFESMFMSGKRKYYGIRYRTVEDAARSVLKDNK